MAIIINPQELLIVVAGFQLTDLPATGNLVEIAEGQPTATYIPSHGTDAFVLGPEWWNVSITVEQGTPSDNWMEQARRAQRALRKVIEVGVSRGVIPMFSSPSMGITTLPPITIAADGKPMRTWVLSGKAVGPVSSGIYVAASALTLEEVQSA